VSYFGVAGLPVSLKRSFETRQARDLRASGALSQNSPFLWLAEVIQIPSVVVLTRRVIRLEGRRVPVLQLESVAGLHANG
jgi:hypothetical protein